MPHVKYKKKVSKRVGKTTKKYRATAIQREEEEYNIQRALEGYRSKKYKSLRAAARDNNIRWVSTLTRRFNGETQSRYNAHADQQLLRPPVEKILAVWAGYLGDMGRPLGKRTLGPLAQKLCGRKPSRVWVYRFLGRHPELLHGRGHGLDPQRAQAFNKPAVTKTCQQLDSFLQERRVTIETLANMDEVGFQPCGQREGTNTMYLFSVTDENRYLLKLDNMELVTILDCIFMNGTLPVRPCFVFSGVHFSEEWGRDVEGNPLVCTTDTGWTNEQVFQYWLENAFVPDSHEQTTPSSEFLLTLDGHESHVKSSSAVFAKEHDTHLFVGLPHATHRMQPCDVGAFGPLKKAWNDRTDEILAERNHPIQMDEVVREYMKVRRKALTPEVIQGAWRDSGFYVDEEGWPRCSADVWNDKDFAPSISSSTRAHLPPGFPELPEIPAFDENKSSSESGSDLDVDEDDADWESDSSDAEMAAVESDDSTDEPPAGDDEGESTGPSPSNMDTSEEDERGSDPDDSGDEAGPHCSDSDHSESDASSSQPRPQPPSLSVDDVLERIHTMRLDEDPPDSPSEPDSDDNEYDFLRRKNERLKARLLDARNRRDEVTAYAILAGQQIEYLKFSLNSRGSKKGRDLALPSGSRFTTADNILVATQEREATRKAKKRHVDQVKQKKDDTAALHRADRLLKGRTGIAFDTPIYKLKLPQLQQLAWCVGVDETGPVPTLKGRLKEFFDLHPARKSDAQFSRMFARKTKSTSGASPALRDDRRAQQRPSQPTPTSSLQCPPAHQYPPMPLPSVPRFLPPNNPFVYPTPPEPPRQYLHEITNSAPYPHDTREPGPASQTPMDPHTLAAASWSPPQPYQVLPSYPPHRYPELPPS